MKRLGLIMMSVALVLGMAQCKKNVETVSEGIGNQNFEDGIIRLKVNDGGKLAVFPHTGGVYYTEGDVLYVASGGAYKGTLTFHDGYFTDFDGTAPDDGATMYFYYLGGKTPSESTGASTLTVNISDQTTGYPVISYGASNETYSTTNAEYTATLKNAGALVKFDVTSSSTTSATCIKGMNNQVSFTSLSGTAPTCGKADTDGIIKLPAGSGERWAVLLPQSAVSEGDYGSAYTSDKHYYGTCGYVPTIESNDYNSKGITVNVTDPSGTVMGMLPGEFTVDSLGKKVHFSKDNLQYRASSSTWRFGEAQYSYVGNATVGNVYDDNGTKCNNANISASYSGWIDLFGWGTSGADTYPPYQSLGNNAYYPYSTEVTDIAGTKYDWGVNEISNASSLKTWRTPTMNEFIYLLNTRAGDEAATVNDTAEVRYVMATINTDGTGVNGLIIFPDGITVAASAATTWGYLNNASNYTTKFTSAQWIALEKQGCVFLPTIGRRTNLTIKDMANGYYWSSKANTTSQALALRFISSGIISYTTNHFNGCAVRLVCE